MDFVTDEMIDVRPDRKKAYLIQYFSMLKHNTFNFTTNISELDNVKFVSIDMYENFRDISRTYFPNAKVCADSFHVLKHLTDDFRKVRIDEANSIFGNCGIAEYEEYNLLLVNWRKEIINSFNIIEGKRINNSYIESKNRLVAKLIYNANGFKNFKRTRNRILFCLNPNDTFKF